MAVKSTEEGVLASAMLETAAEASTSSRRVEQVRCSSLATYSVVRETSKKLPVFKPLPLADGVIKCNELAQKRAGNPAGLELETDDVVQ